MGVRGVAAALLPALAAGLALPPRLPAAPTLRGVTDTPALRGVGVTDVLPARGVPPALPTRGVAEPARASPLRMASQAMVVTTTPRPCASSL